MSEASKTPRTDAVITDHFEEADYAWDIHHRCVDAEFSRTIELELTALREKWGKVAEILCGVNDPDLGEPEDYVNELCAELDRIHEKLSRYQSAEMPERPEHDYETGSGQWLNYATRLEAYCAKLKVEGEQTRARLAEAEAKIDRLMLEYCPDEMTPEQMAAWEKHQSAEQLLKEEKAR